MKNPLKSIGRWFADMARVFVREWQIVIHDQGVMVFFVLLPLMYPIVYTLTRAVRRNRANWGVTLPQPRFLRYISMPQTSPRQKNLSRCATHSPYSIFRTTTARISAA